tara:strand:+ start:360 stop:611 length:252 start_codon:yes stop_codon:yes gene_type:complete
MTPTEIKAIRERAGLTQAGLAALLRISDSRSIRRWEDGSRAVSGPVSILLEMLDTGKPAVALPFVRDYAKETPLSKDAPKPWR